jgi:hypothetical protein
MVSVVPAIGNDRLFDVTGSPAVTAILAVPAADTRLAGTAASTWPALTKVVVRGDPFHWTVAPDTKPAPFTASTKAGLPAVPAAGLSVVMVSALIGNAIEFEAVEPPPVTLTLAVPALASRLAGTAAVNCVELTNVVVSAVPFHCTVDPDAKPVPKADSVNAALPATAEPGLRLVTVNPLMENVAGLVVGPPGFATVILAVPAVAIRFAETVADSCAGLKKDVVSAVPFHWTVEPETNPAPFTIRENAGPPGVTASGLRLVMASARVVKTSAAEGATPVVMTVTLETPALAMRLAGTDAVTWVPLTNVVGRAELFHCTVDVGTNPAPLTVSIKAPPPAVDWSGLRLVSVGVAGALIANVVAVEFVPPGLDTVTLALPALAIRLAGTDADNCAAPRKVVVRAVLFHCTVLPETKFEPVTVSVNAAPPAVADAGFRLVMAGTGALTENETAAETLPFTSVTVTLAVEALAIRLAGTVAVNCVALTKTVERPVPFHCTVSPERKFEPVTVSVNAAPPTVAEVGLSVVSTGPGGLIVNGLCVETRLPEFATVTLALPALAIKLAGTAAVSCVALTTVVVSAVPFHCTVEELKKSVPLTVRVKAAPPAVAEAGLRLVIVGTGTAIVTWTALEALPTVLATVMLPVPGAAIRVEGTTPVN